MREFKNAPVTGVTARTNKHCFFCGELIPRGEKHNRQTGFNGDGWWTIHAHPECCEATKHWKSDDYECFTEGDMKRGVDMATEWREVQTKLGIKHDR